MKAVLYTRVSSYQQIENTSLEQQRLIGEKYCNDYGIQLVQIYREEAVSGRKLIRPELKNAIDFCKKNDVDYFLVYKYDRISRDVSNYTVIRAWLEKAGTTVKSITEPVDDSPGGKLMEHMFAAVAQFENEIRFERLHSGIVTRLKEGLWTFGPPLGYKKTKGIPEPDENFRLIQRIFQLAKTGMYNQREITDLMANKGLKQRNGRPISYQKVSEIIRNPFYAGKIILKEWDVNAEGKHIPAISYQDFKVVQRLVTSESQQTKHFIFNPAYPLNKLIKCHCDTFITGGKSKGNGGEYEYYSCRNRLCTRRLNIGKDKAHFAFKDLLSRIKPAKDLLNLLHLTFLLDKEKETENHKRDLTTLQRRFNEFENQKSVVQEYYEVKDYTRDTYLKRIKEIDEQQTLIALEISDVKTILASTEIEISNAINMLQNLDRLFTTELKPKHRAFIHKILFGEGLKYGNEALTTIQNTGLIEGLNGLEVVKNKMVLNTRDVLNQVYKNLIELSNILASYQVNLQVNV